MKISLKKYLLFVPLSLFFLSANSQEYYQLLGDDSVNFYEKVKAGEAYFEKFGKGKGTGYKQFQRWIINNRPYYDELGNKKSIIPIYKSDKNLRKDGTSEVWKNIGPTNVSFGYSGYHFNDQGVINYLEIDSVNTNNMYAASTEGGIWKTNNAGKDWISLTDKIDYLLVGGLATDPNNFNNIYAIVGKSGDPNSLKFIFSTDSGSTWSINSLPSSLNIYDVNQYTNQLRYFPLSGKLFFAGYSGLYRLDDFPNNWTRISDKKFHEIKYHPKNPKVLVAVGNYGNVLRSTDGGQTFSNIKILNDTQNNCSGGLTDICFSPSNPQIAYLIIPNCVGQYKYLLKTTNGGETFEIVNDQIDKFGYLAGQTFYNLALAINPSNENEIIIGAVWLIISKDGGKNFKDYQDGRSTGLDDFNVSDNANRFHADFHYLKFVKNKLYSGTDGGISIRDDKYKWESWKSLPNISRLTSVNIPNSKKDSLYYLGAQDNGELLYFNNKWRSSGGDGFVGFVDDKSKTWWRSAQSGLIVKGDFDFKNEITITPSKFNDNYNFFITTFTVNSKNINEAYIGYSQVYKTIDGGKSFTKKTSLSKSITGFGITYITSCLNFPENIYLIHNDSLHISNNGGDSWSKLYLPKQTGQYSFYKLAVHPNKPENIILHNFDKIYQSFNYGATWTSIKNNITDNIYCVEFEGTDKEGVYIGTERGTMYKDKTDTNWQYFGLDMPTVAVRDLKINRNINKIYAATWGRGLWFANTVEKTCNLPNNLTFNTGNNLNICKGEVINLQSLENIENVTYVWRKDNSIINNETNKSLKASTSGSYQLEVKSNYCTTLSPLIKIQEIVPPLISTLNGQLEICKNDTISLVSNLIDKTFNYTWLKNGTDISNEIKFIAKEEGSYQLKILRDNCSLLSNSIILKEIQSITPIITLNSLTFSSNTSENNQWLLNGKEITGATGKELEIKESGKYSLSNKQKCGIVYSNEILVSITGNEPNFDDSLLQVFPNPVENIVNIQFHLPKKSKIRISSIDNTGKQIEIIKDDIFPSGKNLIQYDIRRLSAGTIFIVVSSNDIIQIKKVVIL